ncbi:hypothetical protein PFBG_02314 [Plasmodium falciparum 7G8]|uniref:Plasmodium RESA N-terminal domain-containing protein n=1 Tax=Plasmodium falciparum (isolate 7G8) TaxID=57266 RepID=W7FNP3_PLAF8|nr:hypothetical protein PFBG_02314 [Plasmodium falciparum 7G8]
MKCHCVEYYSEENHIQNTTNVRLIRRKFLNLLSITGILLVVVLNNIIICDKNETNDAGVFNIYRRNLSETESVEHSGLSNTSEDVELENGLEENNNNNNISCDLEGSNSEDEVKYNDVTTKRKCDNINYNDLSKQLTLEELHSVLDDLEKSTTKEDLYNIWNQVLGIAKDGFDGMLTELSYYVEEYLHEYEYERYHYFGGRKPVSMKNVRETWYKSMHDIGEALSSTDVKNTLDFYSFVKSGASIDEMKNFIYEFIKYYDTLKNDLFNTHKKIFTEWMKELQGLEKKKTSKNI